MNLEQVPVVQSRGRKKNPDPRGMEMVLVLPICKPEDCHFCRLDQAHAMHVTTSDYMAMIVEARNRG